MMKSSPVVIPSDPSFYLMWVFLGLIFVLVFKITYRYLTSFRAENAVYNTTKKIKPSSKKKQY